MPGTLTTEFFFQSQQFKRYMYMPLLPQNCGRLVDVKCTYKKRYSSYN